MFLGQSRYDPNTFGWAGHREDGGHFTVQGEIFQWHCCDVSVDDFGHTLNYHYCRGAERHQHPVAAAGEAGGVRHGHRGGGGHRLAHRATAARLRHL